MRELYEKMISEAMAAQKADIEVISKNRYNSFKISDAKPYADAVSKMKALDIQAESVINLHKKSVESHFDVLSSITDTIVSEDDPFIEHFQTPEFFCIFSFVWSY